MIKTVMFAATLAMSPALVCAQAPKPSPAKTQAKKASAKAASHAPVTKSSKKSLQTPSPAEIAVQAVALSPEALAIAERVYVGDIPCELGASVKVAADPKTPGRFELTGKGFRYFMMPVATSTGAVRLEDSESGAVWLQIGNKSMLMDQKRGQRLADDCKSPAQITVAEALLKAPPRSLLDEPAK